MVFVRNYAEDFSLWNMNWVNGLALYSGKLRESNELTV